MDLWIRSQNRKHLMKVIEVDISYGEEGVVVINGDNMGRYKTEERAMEVMDEIHQRLIHLQYLELVGVEHISEGMKRDGIDCVYQMPEE